MCGVAIPSEKKTKNAIGSSTNCCCKLVLQRHKKHHGVPRNNLLVRACIVATTFDSGSRKVCRRSGNGAYQEKCLGQAACGEAARHSSEQAQASLARVSSCFWLLHHNLSGLGSYLDVAPGVAPRCSPALHRCGRAPEVSAARKLAIRSPQMH